MKSVTKGPDIEQFRQATYVEASKLRPYSGRSLPWCWSFRETTSATMQGELKPSRLESQCFPDVQLVVGIGIEVIAPQDY